jgi:hypothetical protein
MLKYASISTVLAIAFAGPLAAQRTDQFRAGTPTVLQAQQLPETRIIDYTSVFAAAPESAAPEPALLTEIATWLSANFDLPTSDVLPTIKYATPGQIAAMYDRGLRNGQKQFAAGSDPATLSVGSEIMAVYDTKTQTIFLPEGWRGTTPAEVSLLVHEMVHHLQTRAQIKHACPEEREKLAFAAQGVWLERYGLSLASEFELDGFTLLVRTNCGL